MRFPSFCGEPYTACFYVDRLHALILNEVKYYLEFLIAKMNKRCFNKLFAATQACSFFPLGILKKNISNLTGSEISKGMFLMILFLYDHNIPLAFDSNSLFKESLQILDALSIVAALIAKPRITKYVDEHDVSDLDLLKGKSELLKKSKYFASMKRDNVHLLMDHFFHFTIR